MASTYAHGKRPASDHNATSSKRFKSLYTQTIQITVAATAFTVHADLIRHHTTHFRNMENQAWEEILDYGERFESLDPVTFRPYIVWLYSRTTDLAAAAFSDELHKQPEEFWASRLCHRLFDLWHLADVLGDTTCKNTAIKTLIRENALGNIELATSNCQFVYDKTDIGSGLRRWLVDTALASLNSAEVDRQWIVLPEAIQVDVMKVALGRLGAMVPRESGAEKYYE